MASDSEGSCVASHARREHGVEINSIIESLHDITLSVNKLETNMDDHIAAAATAARQLSAAQSWVDSSLPIRRTDVVRVRDSISGTVSSANRPHSTRLLELQEYQGGVESHARELPSQ
ncbi:hypothetical protein N7501_001899 [Penicillium viridicatum]|nr:hypothetical protein N7501_001899 [Penicillium viridicatum]